MKKDAVSLVVKTDKLILELAKREFLKVGHEDKTKGDWQTAAPTMTKYKKAKCIT